MKFSRKITRRILWVTGGVASALALLYAARWPLFEGLVRREIARLVRERLNADVGIEKLEGSLIFSIAARGVTLHPRGEGEIRGASIRNVEARYGLSGVRVTASGVNADLSGPKTVSSGAAPRALTTLHGARFRGRVEVRDAEVILPGGRKIALDSALLDDPIWTFQFRDETFGEVELRTTFGRAWATRIEAHATRGPMRSCLLELSPSLSLKVETAYEGRPVACTGQVELDRDGILKRVSADITAPGTRAHASVDFESGTAGIEGETALSIREGIRADVTAKGRLEGSFSQWTVASLTAHAKDISFAGLSLDAAELTFSPGPLSALPWRLTGGGVSVQGVAHVEPGIPSLEIECETASIALPKPAGALTHLRLKAGLDKRGVRIDSLQGELGRGPFRARGNWKLWSQGRPAMLHLKGEELLVIDDDRARIRVNPNLTLIWREGRAPRIKGLVHVPFALYYREFGGVGGEQAGAPRVRLMPAATGGFLIPGFPELPDPGPFELDLRVVTTGEFTIENSVVGARVQAEGRVRGTLGAPAISGKVAAHRGEVKLATGIFVRIDVAEMTLPETRGSEPTVHFEGSVGKGEGAILLVVTGPLSQPSLTLQSDPPRSQEELLAYLAFGHPVGGIGGSVILETLAVKAYQHYTDSWPRADPRESFWERLNPSLVDPVAADARRVPWQLPAAGTARGRVLRTEYLLSPHFSVVAESDREANLSGDVKLRIRFR